jgi:hypothetical protein
MKIEYKHNSMLLSRKKCVHADSEDAVISEERLLLDYFLRVHYFMESLPLIISMTVNMI